MPNTAGGDNRRNAAVERVLRLAAYFKLRGVQRVTLADICANVPGYEATFDAEGALHKDATWEAVRKKVRRDLALLSSVFGIEVEFDDNNQEYRLRPPFLSAEERDVLVAAAALVRIDGIEEGQLAALGAAVDTDGQRVVVRVHRHLLMLRSAIAARLPVRFRYRNTAREVECWAVGLWHDRWYTVGLDRRSGGQRVFRLDRIDDDGDGPVIEILYGEEMYDVPERFDAHDALTLDPNNWGQDPPVQARVRVETDWLAHFQREFGGTVVDRGPSAAIVELTVRHYESFRDRLLGLGTHAVLLEPLALVEQLRSWLVGMAS